MIGRLGLHGEGDCHRARRQLAAYADQALGDADREAVAEHLAGCAPCRGELAEMTQTRTLLGIAARTCAPAAAPSGLAERLVAIAGEQADRQLWLCPEGDGQLPSRRRQVRQRALMGATAATLGMAGAVGAAFLSAPELDRVADPDASRVASLGLPHAAEAANRDVLARAELLPSPPRAADLDEAPTRMALTGPSDAVEQAPCPPQAHCPEALSDLPLVLRERLDEQPTTVRSTFTDRDRALVLVQQRGMLLAEAGRQGCDQLWQSGQWVYCLVLAHGDEALAERAVSELPHGAPVTGDLDDRVLMGLRTLVGERGR